MFFSYHKKSSDDGGQQISAKMSNIEGDIWQFLIIGWLLMSMVVTALSLLTCCDSRFLSVCTQKTTYQKFKLIRFKTHDFSTINMIIRIKTDVFSRYQL